ncbi:MAG: transcriptional regulator [Candidatus Nitrosotenuis sp.]
MNALDKLFAQSVASVIRKNLGEKTYLTIEKRLVERWSMKVVDAIQDFNKFDAILREIFGAGADAVEYDILHKIFSFEASKKGTSLISIEDPDLAKAVLEAYGNPEKRLILNSAFNKPAPILNILENCNIPKSTGYRVIAEMLDEGFLAESGFTTTSDGKKVSKYTSLFYEIRINIKLEELTVAVILKDEVVRESNLIKVIQGRF